ncbi:hypothetical protein HBO15_21540 [Pseudomonas sp. WS 5111]|uniref:hypothetical protein n=1 Tax=Pseudomonas sp. WS 5111 TaxID=2717493 RepID=UPI0014767ED8|nr:hypothetical protein [Pseudomonas sp. WS 5111]NMX69940.1 hypothetical protein [Pseudomonas sp. WS 5111]
MRSLGGAASLNSLGQKRKQRPKPLLFGALYLLNDFEQAASPIGRLQDSNQFFRKVTRNDFFHWLKLHRLRATP